MSTEKHTPGPWSIEGSFRQGERTGFIISHGTNSYGDGPQDYVGRVEVSKADARLIAAAPDLLASVKDAHSMLKTVEVVDGENGDPWSVALARMEAAIAKAREA